MSLRSSKFGVETGPFGPRSIYFRRGLMGIAPAVLICLFCGFVLFAIRPTEAAETAVDCDDPGITCHTGDLAGNETWSNNAIHVIEDDFTVPAGTTLTVEAGTIVKVDQFSSHFFTINGTLQVNGTVSDPVIFTADEDDSAGGDTDNVSDTPRASDWNGLLIANGGVANITHAEVRYAGDRNDYGAIHVDDGSVDLSNLLILASDWSGISVPTNYLPQMENVTVTDSYMDGLEIREGTLGAPTVWDEVGMPIVPSGNITVPTGLSLDIEAGVTIKFAVNKDVSIIVDGTLNLNGTASDFVVLSGIEDNTAFGDTTSSNSRPFSGEWESIYYRPGSSGTINYADIRYGGVRSSGVERGAIHVENGSVAITNSLFYENRVGISNGGSNPLPTITSSEFTANDDAVVNTNANVVISATGNYWDSIQGPDDNSDEDGVSNSNSDGENVSDYVDYSSYLIAPLFSRMTIDRPDLDLSATVDQSGPDSPSVTIFNVGPGSFTWTATEDIPWLSLTIASGSDGNRLEMAVDTTGLVADDYTGVVEIVSTATALPIQELFVTLEVVPSAESAPGLGILNEPLSFVTIEGGAVPEPDFFTVVNTGTGTLDWTLTESIPWLAVNRTSGSGESTVEGTVDISGLAEGRYLETLEVTAAGKSQTVDVSLTIGCLDPEPADIFIVMDRSSSMGTRTMNDAKEAAISFVNQIDFSRDRVGLVTFESDAALDVDLTQDKDALINQISQIRSDGGTDIASGILTAREVLAQSSENTVIVLLSDGRSDAEEAVREAFLAKVQETLMVTIGLGNGVDEETLTRVASTPQDYYFSPNSTQLTDIYSEISVIVGCGTPLTALERAYTPFIVR